MKVYVAMVCDRHADPEPEVFSTAEAAIAYVREYVNEYARYPEDVEEDPVEGWLFYIRWSEEGDRAWVVEKEVDAEVGADRG